MTIDVLHDVMQERSDQDLWIRFAGSQKDVEDPQRVLPVRVACVLADLTDRVVSSPHVVESPDDLAACEYSGSVRHTTILIGSAAKYNRMNLLSALRAAT